MPKPDSTPSSAGGFSEEMLRAALRGKRPLIVVRPREKAPLEKGWTKALPDEEALWAAQRNGFNFGYRIEHYVVVLDYDPRNDPDGDALDRLRDDTGLDDRYVVRTPSGGCHIYFRKPQGCGKLGEGVEGYPGIELKQHGRQVLVPGAIHPNGGVYAVDEFSSLNPDSPKESWPELPRKLIELSAKKAVAETAASSAELARRVLDALDPGDFPDNPTWEPLMMAFADTFGKDAVDEFVEWCGHEFDDVRTRYLSLDGTKLTRRSKGTLIKILTETAAEGGEEQNELQRLARELAGGAVEDFADANGGTKSGMAEWAYVADADAFINVEDLRMWTPAQYSRQFAKSWAARDGKGEPAKAAVEGRVRGVSLLETPVYQPYEERLPDGPDGRRFNLWRPSGIEPGDGDCSWLKEHLAYLLPDDLERSHLEDFLTILCSRPAIKSQFGLILGGGGGIGKSAIAQMMRSILGRTNVSVPDNTDLASSNNSWIEAKQLVVIEELMQPGRIEVANKLKGYVTQPTVRVNEKYIKAYEVDNLANFMCFTNHRDALKVQDDDDRRWLVLWSDAEPKETAYYDELFSRLGDPESLSAALGWLANRPLERLEPNGRAPMTSAKVDDG